MSKGIILADNHFFLTSAFDVKAICDPLLKSLNIKFFTYSRNYMNGESLMLTNYNGWLINHLKNGYLFPSPIPNAFKERIESFLIPTLNGPHKRVIDDLINKFHSMPGIGLLYNKKQYFEIFCFCYKSDEIGFINNFLNNLDVLKKFALYFREKAEKLIKIAEKNKILLPNHMRGLDFTDLQSDDVLIANTSEFQHITKFDKICIEGNYGYVNLSQQESRSINFLIKGNSVKETAQLMLLSPRTIEGYLNTIKLKLGCKTKNEVIRLITQKAVL